MIIRQALLMKRPKQVSQAGIRNYIPQFTVGCNYLSLPEVPASGSNVLIYGDCLHECHVMINHISMEEDGGHFTTHEISGKTYQFHSHNITIIRKAHLISTSKIDIF